MIMPVTEAIVNELTSQQIGNRDSKRIRKISQQQQQLKEQQQKEQQQNSYQQKEQNLNNNYQQHNHNIHEAEQNLINHNENHKCTNLVSVITKNDKVATIKETPISNGPVEKSVNDIPIDPDENKTLRVAFYLSIAYSANIGGTGTLTGTGPNLVLQGIMDEYYPNLNDLSFASWCIYAMPGAILLVLLTWLFLKTYYLRNFESTNKQTKQLHLYLHKRYQSLGPITFHEFATMLCFFVILMLWFFRAPKFILGWEEFLNTGVKVWTGSEKFLSGLFEIFINRIFKNFSTTSISPIHSFRSLTDWRRNTGTFHFVHHVHHTFELQAVHKRFEIWRTHPVSD